MTNFRTRIRAALANEALQIALDNNAERRTSGRIHAYASLPDWRERRQEAHAVRAEVIEHLEEYLEQFLSNAKQNGIIVHRAKDGAEAIKIILEIVRHSPRRTQSNTKEPFVPLRDLRGESILIAKAKSMISEEIDLNSALEAAGIRVIETDLGEYIVQLRHERPGHILTPAVHLRRQDVGKLFHEKLGIPYTDDIPTLTDTARQLLRDVFLSADVGISGVNFGVAETGTLCLVTNEGNARMVTALPPVHIALMGMERLVRNLDDLALMLSLLPRAATGQKLSVYTQLIRSPFPGQQRHLVLLDNGRTGIRNSPLKESLYCIRCGACLNACPVFREIGGHAYDSPYSGPIGSVISAGFFGSDFVPLAQASSLCGACKEACPVDIDLPKLLSRVRAGQLPVSSKQSSLNSSQLSVGSHGLSRLGKLFMQIFSWVARRPRLFVLTQRLAGLGTRIVSPFNEYVPMPAFTGWGYSKDLPRFAMKPFRARFQREDASSVILSEATPAPGTGAGEDLAAPYTAPTVGADSRPPITVQFIDELIKVNGSVTRTDPEDVTDKIIEFLRSRAVDQIHLEPNVLDEVALEKAGIAVSHEPDAALPVGVTPHVSPTQKETCGVTKAVCGLADTGSIVIVDGAGNPLQASLLPRVHIAVLCRSDILPSLPDALALPIVRAAGSAVVITGPSRTADIEMSLTIGMHGPGELHVFLVDD
jgi:L-lactate dehydrogenase complex protein LldF